ncbi:MAG: hypothetical protein A2V46_13105 [Bacteroidetes bacterium RBG_19FT_COMBO_42_7]|nr:MAG: hypothetical protein A2V46_13105 [Bacteroidetes bacterium RBG_19FT_COMBO_42_7]
MTAIDTDNSALEWLQKKIISKKLEKKITTINVSFFDFKSDPGFYDIILAEGFLNIIGFEPGFPEVINMLKSNGYFIIHDELRENEKKCECIRKNRCELIDSLFLDEKVWWNDYYKQLDNEINTVKNGQLADLFSSDLKEIEYYKQDPSPFKSIYYIVRKL